MLVSSSVVSVVLVLVVMMLGCRLWCGIRVFV